MAERETPLVYIYLDRDGIESLYAQTTERMEIQVKRSTSRQGSGEVSLTASFGNLLTSLLGVKEVGAETKLETVHGYINEAKSKLTIEHKLQRLAEYLAKTKKCLVSLEGAASKASVDEMVYVNAVERFDAPDFYPGRGGVREINESGAMVFTIDRDYDPSDEYFKRENLHFVMAAGLRNFTRLRGDMGATSHDAIMFRGFGGNKIPLGVFGSFHRYSDLACQIKPYAIWLP